MAATASARNKFYSEREVIDEGAKDHYEAIAEQQRQDDKENARQCIIDGIDPRTGKTLTLEEHQGALLRIHATLGELSVYEERLRQKRAEEVAADMELACLVNAQYPCTSCTHLLDSDTADLNPAQQMLREMIS